MATTESPADFDETVADIEESLGIVPGYLEALPEQELVNEWPNMKRFLFGETEIPPKYREIVGLTIAANLSCPYCSHFHKGAAELHGATEAELAAASFLASYTPRYSAILHAQDYDVDTFKEETAEIAEYLQQQVAASDD